MNQYYTITTHLLRRKLVPLCLTLLTLLLMQFYAHAQYANVPVTGFNADVVADGATGAATNSTTADVDGVNYVFVSSTFNPGPGICATGTTALPVANTITSLITPALTYNLQPYNANNILRLSAGTTGTFTLVTPTSASNLYLLATGGSGACNLSVTINFTDLTTQVITGTINDWCSAAGPATTVFYRIINTSTTCNGGTCQYLYELNMALSGANYSKTIASVQIQNLAGGGVLNAFALGAKSVCPVPTAQPTALISTATTTGSISASFTDASTLPTGGYLVVRYPASATPTAPVNGTTYTPGQSLGTGTIISASLTPSFSATGLNGNTTYNFYVYSYNTGTTCGGPIYLTTTPLLGSLATSVCGTVPSTIAIGPGLPNTLGGGFTSLTAALTAIGSNGLSGNTVLELQATYDGTAPNETFPILFPYNACVGVSKTITIRPASGVSSPITITSDSLTTLNLNGASYITIDGRPGGTGTTSQLKIINTKTTGAAVQFINDAHHNMIRYCDIQGQNTSATSTALSGVIYFAGTSTLALTGNDYNTIANCDIHATTLDFPAIAVCSYGNNVAAPVTSWNDSNTITNCNIYDFYSATLASTGIKLEGGSNAFTVSNNRLYQTATRNYTASNQHRAFWLTTGSTGACGFQILNNFIGGNNAAGTGTWTLTSNASILTNFWGMDINHGGLTRTSVQGNTITNLSLSSSTATANDLFRGISTGGSGNVDIGNITGNTIGAATGTGAISLNTTANSSISYGIKAASTIDTVNVYNNTIGSITLTSATAANAMNFFGIGVISGSAYTYVVGNTIGSLSTPLSINSIDSATTTQSVYGISVAGGIYTTVINNTVANLNNNYKSTSTGYTRGIYLTSSTTSVITGNSIRNLSTASTYTGSGTTAALTGIQMSSANPSTVSGNSIDSLVLTSLSTGIASYVEGIVFSSNGSTPTNLITKNFIHSLDVSAVNTSAFMIGIDIVGGSNIIANNMIRLGIKPDGTDLTTSMVIRGIHIGTTTAENIYHNSVYIGGANVGSTTANTAALHRNTSTLGSQHDIRNNIFVNERSNTATGGKHYQVFLNNTVALSLGTNSYFGTGTGSVFGTLNGGTADVLSYTLGWLSTDMGSSITNPRFMNATGTAATLNLHINAVTPTPVEATGLLLSTITDDYDGQTRSSNTPVDIGADGGAFTPLPMSIDSSVVDQNTALVPKGSTNQYVLRIRMYAKDNYNPLQLTSFVMNTAGTTSASDISNAKVFSTGSSPIFATTTQYGTAVAAPSGAFSVTGSASLTSGVNYFWVTYDITNTAVINNTVDVRLDNIVLSGAASPAILNGNPTGSRTIKNPLAGPYNIGTGQPYTTIAAAMTDLNSLGVSAAVTLNLTDAMYTLTDSIAVNVIPGVSATNTVTLMPAAANASGATITSSSSTSTFDMNGVSYFIIDGRPGGGAFPIAVPNTTNLNIINTSVTGSAIRMNNDSRRNTIKYCDLQGTNNVNATLQGTSAGVVFIGLTNGTTGNDSNTLDNCNIHSTVNTGVLTMGIYSYGPSSSSALTSLFNDNNTVSNCNIYDIYGGANLSTGGIVLERGTNTWTLTGNSFFQTVTRTPALTASIFNRNIYIATTNTTGVGNGFTITGNYFGGTQPQCGGTPYTSTPTGGFNNLHEGIYISVNGGTATNIKGNTFTNANISQAASTS
ncbi:MAG: BNR-repeat neuraminidase N-terminal domain-containing protein, partial [Bacteroidota bacterium]